MFSILSIRTWLIKRIAMRDILIIAGLILAYWLTRLFRLDHFPIFSDEGIYIHWAKTAWHDATWRFISLTDGRQPLQTWATIPFLKLFPDNALIGGRLFAVSAGFIGMLGMMVLTAYLYGRRAAYFAGLLMVATPYFFFYDRLALADSAVTAGTIWMLFLAFLLARTRRMDVALAFGIVTGMTLLTKSSIRLYAGLFFGTSLLILFPAKNMKAKLVTILGKARKGMAHSWAALCDFGILYLFAMALALVLYNVQRLSPFFHFVSQKNATFILTTQELLANPFGVLPVNLYRIPMYLTWELGFIVMLFSLCGLYLLLRKKDMPGVVLTLIIVASYVLIALVARVLFPRYIMAIAAFLVVPAAYYLSSLKRTLLIPFLILYALFMAPWFYTIYFQPRDIPFPQIDRGQYIEGWPAGWGAREIMEFAREKSHEKPVLLVVEGTFGMTADVLDTFQQPGDQIEVKGYWPLEEKDLIENQQYLESKKVYVVFAHRRKFLTSWPINWIKQYDKPGDESEITLFELLPPTR
jgi:4-amino-4-deoxy-L-arabinose transferase-like glycosyltransferase